MDHLPNEMRGAELHVHVNTGVTKKQVVGIVAVMFLGKALLSKAYREWKYNQAMNGGGG